MGLTFAWRHRGAVFAFASISLLAMSFGAAQGRGPQPQTPAQIEARARAQAAQQELQKKFAYPIVRDQTGAIPPAPRPLPAPPLGDGPWVFSTLEQRDVKATIVTRGLSHPWSLAFLPDGSILITEKIGRLRIVRNGVL